MAKISQIVITAAGIVTYNPDSDRLKNNINAISGQVKQVYCFDNGSANIEEIRTLCCQYENVTIIENGKNSGIAEGLNQIIREARKNEIAWLLTLDQDSVCPAKMIDTMLKYSDEENIVAICPRIVDKRRPTEIQREEGTDRIDFCITSGCFVNTTECEKIGDFDS